MTDQDVIDLYRCLLARAPEAADTVAAFRAYYEDFARGRMAILQSAEFRDAYDALAGGPLPRLMQALLARAGGSWATLRPPIETAMTGAMRMVLRTHGAVRMAVVAGAPEADLAALLPGLPAQAVVLHISPEFPPVLPQIGALPDGAAVLRLGLSVTACAAWLREMALPVDLLALGDADAGPFLPALAASAILVGLPALPEVVASWADIETPPSPPGVDLRFRNGWFLPVEAALMTEPAPDEGPIAGLCVAAILRDEAEAAPHMIASLAPVAESFTILDTGSTDGTQEAVQAVLRETGRHFVLQSITADRFDDMRNAALDLAPEGTCWVLMLDGDEAMGAGDRAALRELLLHAAEPAYALPRYNYPSPEASGRVTPYPDRQVRLLRWNGAERPRYSGAVHETIRNLPVTRLPLDARALGGGAGGPHIHHLVRRFRSAEAEARKQQRYRDIAARYSG